MPNLEQEIDVHIMTGENGVVHVRTDENLEREIVDDQFEQITAKIGDLAIDVVVPGVRENNTDREARELGKMNRQYKGRPTHPTKTHK